MSHPSTPRSLCVLLLLNKSLFQLGSFPFLNFNLLFNLNLAFSCFLSNLQVLFCCSVLMTFSRAFSLVIGLTSSRHCSLRALQPTIGTALSELLILTCCWVCSSRLLLAVLFLPLDTSLSLRSADLLLVVVQVLRFCAPFRQSGSASFVNFFSSLALLAVMLSVLSVFWRRLLQHYIAEVYCSEIRLLHLQRHYSVCASS